MQGRDRCVRGFARLSYVAGCIVALVAASRAQHVARSEGPARFALPAAGREAGPRLVVREGRVVGFGECVELARGALGSWLEFRGYVPRGAFSLRLPSAAAQRRSGRLREHSGLRRPGIHSRRKLPRIRIGASTLHFERAEGELCARWRVRSRLHDLRVRGDAYAWSSGLRELRLELSFVEGGERVPERLDVRWADVALGIVGEGERRFAAAPSIDVAALELRPGDRAHVTLASKPGDPSRRVWASEGLLAWSGYAESSKGGDRGSRDLVKRLHAHVLALARASSPLDRGDHRRKTGDEEIWTHGEFDLPLGLELLAQALHDPLVASRARESALHLLGRDFAPASCPGHAGLRLPAVHGVEHGRGRVAAGHVFLEGALVHALAGAERLLLERVHGALSDLSVFVDARAGSAYAMRDVAWPLRQLAIGLRVWDRAEWRARLGRLVQGLRGRFDAQLGVFDFEAARRSEGWELPLWLVAGLLLPGLERAAEIEIPDAGALRRRILRAVSRLPRGPGGGLATHYFVTERGEVRVASRGRRNEVCAAWLVEGLLRAPGSASVRSKVRRLRRQLLRRLPAGQWDPATEAAMLLRLCWVRAGARSLRRDR